jgi:hypothetical protein
MTYQFEQFDTALRLLAGRLALAGAPPYNLVVCGGTALVATELVERATRDVDVVALSDAKGNLIDPAPLPAPLVQAAQEVAEDLGLPRDWLNNGPSSGPGGLYQLGLTAGFSERLNWREFGVKLRVAFIGRLDQIFFKLYAAVDQLGSYHADDLLALKPTNGELLAAIAWAGTHDPSEGFRESLRMFLREYGYGHLADGI